MEETTSNMRRRKKKTGTCPFLFSHIHTAVWIIFAIS